LDHEPVVAESVPPVSVFPVTTGSAVFAGLGLTMAGALRAEATLAGANALYLACLLIGDGVLPLDHLPGPIQVVASLLPPATLTDSIRAAMTTPAYLPWLPMLVLVAWAAIISTVAVKTFRWD